MPPIDTFAFYSSDDEGDEGDSSMKVVEGNCFSLVNESNASVSRIAN